MTTLAVIGGSGLYSIKGLDVLDELAIDTPFGAPSAAIKRARLGKTEILFLPRHGTGHTLLPSEVNYRANIYALKVLGAEWCLGVSAVGSLKEEISPGHVAIPEQIIDKTYRRAGTFFGSGIVAHVALAEPFCPTMREVVKQACERASQKRNFCYHQHGTYVCMEGPAFSTRAESLMHRAWGADLIGMTAMPEAKLAREAELAYATLALVTDFDCWKQDGEHVTVEKVAALLQSNASLACEVLIELAQLLPTYSPSQTARSALKDAIFCDLKQAPKNSIEALRPILAKYLR